MYSDKEVETGTISVGDAAKRLGIGRPLAYELARRRELPGARRLGSRIVVLRAVLERWLDEGVGESSGDP